MDSHSAYERELQIVVQVASYMSGLGDLLIIVSCHRYSALGMAFSRKLLYYQSIADLVVSLAVVALSTANQYQCTIQGYLIVVMTLSSTLWVLMMSFILVMITDMRRIRAQGFRPDDYAWLYHLICWGLPIVLGLCAFLAGCSYAFGNQVL
jgi:hypothetical protein